MKRKDLRILLGLVILAAAFLRGTWLTVGLCVLGIGWLLLQAFSSRKEIFAFFSKIKAKRLAKKEAKAKKTDPVLTSAAHDAPPKDEPKSPSVCPERALIRHINHRITDKLRSAYPNAFWDWAEKPTVSFITEGGSRRITVTGAGEFNYAEIKLDRFSNITLDLMKVIPCEKANPDEVVTDYPVDVECWYSNNAQSILENIIGDLNAKGVTSLTIDANGKIEALEGEKKNTYATLDNMPQKASWKAIADMLIEQFELKASVGKNVIRVSW